MNWLAHQYLGTTLDRLPEGVSPLALGAIGIQAYREGLPVQEYISLYVPTGGSVYQCLSGCGWSALLVEGDGDYEVSVYDFSLHGILL